MMAGTATMGKVKGLQPYYSHEVRRHEIEVKKHMLSCAAEDCAPCLQEALYNWSDSSRDEHRCA